MILQAQSGTQTGAQVPSNTQFANSAASESKREALHARLDAADRQQSEAATKAGVSKDVPAMLVSQDAQGQRTITIPDGKGGSTTIVMDKDGVAVGGRRILPAYTNGPPGREREMPVRRSIFDNSVLMALLLIALGAPVFRIVMHLLERRTASSPADAENARRLQAIERAVESIAEEVERMSEAQRFTTRVLTERSQSPAREFASRAEREKTEPSHD